MNKKNWIVTILLCVIILVVALLCTAEKNGISGYFSDIRIDNEYDRETIDFLVESDAFNSASFKSDYSQHPEDYKMYAVTVSMENTTSQTLHWLNYRIPHLPDGIYYLDRQLSWDFDYYLEPHEKIEDETCVFLVNTKLFPEESTEGIFKNFHIRVSYQGYIPLNLNYSVLRYQDTTEINTEDTQKSPLC